MNFINIDAVNASQYLHEYLLYVGTFISITLIVTTFLFNFLKSTVEFNLNIIISYVGYEFVAYYGFFLVIYFVIQKMLVFNLSESSVENLLVVSFYLTLTFLLLLVYLYNRIFLIIRPDKLKKINIDYLKIICSKYIYEELKLTNSLNIYKSLCSKFGYKETSNAEYFFGAESQKGVLYFFKDRTSDVKYLKDVKVNKLMHHNISYKGENVFVPIHLNQTFPSNNDYLLMGLESPKDESKKLRKKILSCFLFTSKKNIDYEHSKEIADSVLNKLYDSLNQHVSKNDEKGVTDSLEYLDIAFDLYIENFS
ncbi:hypothetical protein NYZ99_10005 [Maribacter litopenaei]|uniref:GAF domain-containing protein n=1 Tax=Maribacter litopenaei TaxID=2976127 RepID=A0ABY5YBN6_9FLAO|nr:hypothetical protein [Maribacter litopenaei]UWX56482.1 hypothetical protein NYZ99_10005 [Maribacter litopenaei]